MLIDIKGKAKLFGKQTILKPAPPCKSESVIWTFAREKIIVNYWEAWEEGMK